jgi:hypothetical protein
VTPVLSGARGAQQPTFAERRKFKYFICRNARSAARTARKGNSGHLHKMRKQVRNKILNY